MVWVAGQDLCHEEQSVDLELQMVLSVHLCLIQLGLLVGLSLLVEAEMVELVTQLRVDPSFMNCEASSS